MKRVYERPMMFAQKFTSNEYVAACGESGTVYNFQCNAGDRPYQCEPSYIPFFCEHGEDVTDNYPYDVYTSTGEHLGSYGPCGTSHEANSSDDFIFGGYMVHQHTGETIKVTIWRGADGNNIHCTTILDQKQWETAKS